MVDHRGADEGSSAGLETRTASEASGIARAAGINSLGNVASRALGLVRESVISGTFGASGATSAFDAVSGVPKMVYELLIGGMLSAALVPILSEYASNADDTSLPEILSVLLSLALVVLIAIVVLLELLAPWLASLLVGGFDAPLLATATRLVRIIVPAILVYGLSGILQAYHYARRRFAYPAAGAPAHNLGIILTVLLLASYLGISALSVGIVVAALFQLSVQLPGLRGLKLHWRPDWRHPVVRRILQLYAPVLVSIVIQNVGIVIDRNLASRTVPEAITWMTKATFLIQLPLGLVSMAISLAVLPTLSQIDASEALEAFKDTLSQGLRLVLAVIIPAAAGLLVLGNPIIKLIFEHGAFTPEDTRWTWTALCLYLPGLPFAAIDLPLVFAFYAQKDTVTPVIVGIIGVALYLAIGPALAFGFQLGFLGLVLANAGQLIGHALIMLWVFRRRFAGLRGYGVLRTAFKAAIASLGLAASGFLSYRLLVPWMPVGFLGELCVVILPGVVASGVYILVARALCLREIELLCRVVASRLGGQ